MCITYTMRTIMVKLYKSITVNELCFEATNYILRMLWYGIYSHKTKNTHRKVLNHPKPTLSWLCADQSICTYFLIPFFLFLAGILVQYLLHRSFEFIQLRGHLRLKLLPLLVTGVLGLGLVFVLDQGQVLAKDHMVPLLQPVQQHPIYALCMDQDMAISHLGGIEMTKQKDRKLFNLSKGMRKLGAYCNLYNNWARQC